MPLLSFLGEPTVDETQTAWFESGELRQPQDSMIESKRLEFGLQRAPIALLTHSS
jgi:hypothetical protein